MAERGIDVSYETVRRWVYKFGIDYARRIKERMPLLHTEWFLNELFVKIDEKPVHLWRAVDDEGEVLDVLFRSAGTSGRPCNFSGNYF